MRLLFVVKRCFMFHVLRFAIYFIQLQSIFRMSQETMFLLRVFTYIFLLKAHFRGNFTHILMKSILLRNLINFTDFYIHFNKIVHDPYKTFFFCIDNCPRGSGWLKKCPRGLWMAPLHVLVTFTVFNWLTDWQFFSFHFLPTFLAKRVDCFFTCL